MKEISLESKQLCFIHLFCEWEYFWTLTIYRKKKQDFHLDTHSSCGHCVVYILFLGKYQQGSTYYPMIQSLSKHMQLLMNVSVSFSWEFTDVMAHLVLRFLVHLGVDQQVRGWWWRRLTVAVLSVTENPCEKSVF